MIREYYAFPREIEIYCGLLQHKQAPDSRMPPGSYGATSLHTNLLTYLLRRLRRIYPKAVYRLAGPIPRCACSTKKSFFYLRQSQRERPSEAMPPRPYGAKTTHQTEDTHTPAPRLLSYSGFDRDGEVARGVGRLLPW